MTYDINTDLLYDLDENRIVCIPVGHISRLSRECRGLINRHIKTRFHYTEVQSPDALYSLWHWGYIEPQCHTGYARSSGCGYWRLTDKGIKLRKQLKRRNG